MTSPDAKAQDEAKPQRLHLVFGGELKSLESHEFRDPAKLDIVGLFPDYASAERAWRAKAQQTVDNAQTRYFIVHLHRLLEPDLTPLRRGLPERRMARRVGRSPWAQEAIGFGLAAYLSFVRATSRFITVPEDVDAYIKDDLPLIAAMWHGQHLMMPFARPVTMERLAVLISRHEDAGAQALAAERLGITAVRGSGGPADRGYYKGGAPAMRELLRQLESGSSVAMTADVPKRARVAGMGIVTLAKLSGRPIVPTAAVMSRRVQFSTWDRASLGLPFGRAVIVVGDIIHVSRDADDEEMEAARLAVERGLDETHRQGYAMVGASDPGADLKPR